MKKQWIQHKKMITGKRAVTARKLWFVEVFEEFLCVFLSTQTSTSALLTAPVTIFVSTLPAVSSASVTKATSSTASRTVEVSLNLSSVAWLWNVLFISLHPTSAAFFATLQSAALPLRSCLHDNVFWENVTLLLRFGHPSTGQRRLRFLKTEQYV